MKPGRRRQLDNSGSEEAAEKHKASMRANSGASVPVRESGTSGTRRCATGVCRRTRSGSRFCWVSRNLLIAGPLRDGVNVGPLRPFSAGTAGKRDGSRRIRSFQVVSEPTNGSTFQRGNGFPLPSACPPPCGDRKPSLIRPSLDAIKPTRENLHSLDRLSLHTKAVVLEQVAQAIPVDQVNRDRAVTGSLV